MIQNLALTDSDKQGGLPKMIVQSDGPMRDTAKWRGAGVAVPVFSLRSQSSVGAGEYVDLRPLIELCAEAGTQLP